MSIEDNKAIVRRYREMHSTNQLDQLDEVLSADLMSHSLLPGVPTGLEGARMVHAGNLAMFPDLHVETDDLIAEGDKVVERWTQTFTHTGAPFMGAPATGRKVAVTGVSIYRIANGKIVEHWGEMNVQSVLQQLGLAPSPG